MKPKMIIKVWTYFIVYNVLLSKIVVCFEYTHFDHKCRDVPNHKLILTLNVNSLNKCVKQCSLRNKCLSVIYKRLFPICELYSVDVSEVQHAKLGTSCTVIRRDDIHLDGSEVIKSYELLHEYVIILFLLLRWYLYVISTICAYN